MFKNKIVSFYLMAQFVKNFFLLLFSFTGIVAIGIFIEKFKKYEGIDTLTSFKFIGMQLFEFIHPVIPLSLLMATMLTFWKFTRTSELVIMRGAGLSSFDILRPFMMFAFFVGLADVFILNPVTAYMNKQMDEMNYKYGISNSSPLDLSEKGFWIKEKRDKEYFYTYSSTIKQIEDALYLNGAIVFITDKNHNFVKRYDAEVGTMSHNVFSFKNLREVSPGKKDKLIPKLEFQTQLTIDKIKDTYASTSIISFTELPRMIVFFKALGFSVRKLVSYFLSLLVFPFFLVVFTLIGAGFTFTNNIRGGRLFGKMAIGIGVGFVTYFFDQIVSSMGASGQIPLVLGVFGIPLLSGVLIYYYILQTQE